MQLRLLVKNLDYGLLLPLTARLPVRMAGRLTDWRGNLTYLLRREGRLSSIRNMSLAFPSMSEKELTRNVRGSCRALSRDEMESYWFDKPLSWLQRLIRIKGLDVLKDALAAGRGVLFYTGHIGSTGFFITVLGKMGIPMNLVFRSVDEIPSMPKTWYRYGRMRVRRLEEASDRPLLLTGRTNYFTMRRKLKEGEIVLMGLDVLPEFTTRTTRVSLFGRTASFPVGLAQLYLDSGARVLLWGMHRDERGIHQAEIRDVSDRLRGLQKREEVTQVLVGLLEERIRRYPQDWLQWEALHQYLE